MDSIEVYVWLIVFIVLTAIEMATFQLVTIWFAVGAVAAFITSLFSTSLEIQLIVFLAVSMLLLILVRPIAGRFLQTKTVKTNVDSLIGDYATVTARIHNQEGLGKAVIRGQEWTAAAEKDDEIIEAGSRVVVTGIRGVKLIVAKMADAVIEANQGEEAITAEDAGVTEEAVEAAEATDIEEVADAE